MDEERKNIIFPPRKSRYAKLISDQPCFILAFKQALNRVVHSITHECHQVLSLF